MGDEKITEQELNMISEAKSRKAIALQVVKHANLEAQNAELAHQVAVQHIFIKYGLTFNDQISDETGVITRVSKTEEQGFVKNGDASEGAAVDESPEEAEEEEDK